MKIARQKINTLPFYLGPGLVNHRLFLNEVALDPLSSVSVRELPDQPHGGTGYISDLQVLWRSRNIFKHNQKQSQP